VAEGATINTIDLSLSRLQTCRERLVVPAALCRDIELLKGQIELRRLALADIAVIRSRLRSCSGYTSQKVGRQAARRLGRLRLRSSLGRPCRLAGLRI
jgi:hypothetical protein